MSDLITALVVDLTNVGFRLAIFFFLLQVNPYYAYLISGLYCINYLAKFFHKRNVMKKDLEYFNNLLKANEEAQKKQERLDRF